jgi:hypothetical protein
MTLLDQTAKQAALEILDSDYRVSDTPLSATQRDAWLGVLEKLERGELKPALEALGYERRPGPLEVLQTVLEARRTGSRPVRAKPPSIARETLEKARSDLRKRTEQ